MTDAINWIIDDQSLREHCQQWHSLPYLVLDTEFVRVDTFYAEAGLIQIGAAQQVYLLDPLRLSDWSPLARLLEDSQVVKVLHACGEDLEVLKRLTGALPKPLFDSQLAAAYLNLGFSLGYSKLVAQELGVQLAKEETRSDWLQRPLTPLQEQYAAQDVLYLGQLYQRLDARLSEQKHTWLFEDGAELVAAQTQEQDPQQLWREVKLAWKLKPQQLAVLRALCAWREEQARARNLPRSWVLREASLWPLAAYQPKDLAALSRIEEMRPRTLRQDGATLLELIAQAASSDPHTWPQTLAEPLPLEAGALLKKLRAIGQTQAQILDIVPEIVLRKKTLEALLRTGYPNGPYHLPDSLRGWRRELFAAPLLAALESA